MAIVQTGSVLQFAGLGAVNTGSISSITVPTDAEFMVVGWSSYSGSTAFFSGGGMTFTKGGVDTAMTYAGGDNGSAGWSGPCFYMVLPDTGSGKTLKWDWAGSGTAGDASTLCSITFWKGVDTASPVRATGMGTGGNTPYTTGSIAGSSGDLAVAWVGAFANAEGSINSWSNLTTLSQITRSGSADGAWATGSPSGSSTYAASTDTQLDDGTITVIILKPAAGGSNKTLTADVGSYSLSGTAATLRHARVLPAAAGSYALTGTAAGLKHGYKVGAGVGSYALTGSTAALRKTWVMTASAGSYSLTGTAAGLKHAWLLTAGAGSYALSGTAAGLKHGWNLPAGSGSYALSGTDAGLVKTGVKTLAADAGSYSLSGTAASVLHGWKIAAGAGSYSLSGATSALRHAWTLPAGAGSYALSGQAAGLVHGWKLGAASGSYSLTGSDAALTHLSGKILSAGAGSYSLSGASASLIQSRILVAGSGSYLLSGADVGLTTASAATRNTSGGGRGRKGSFYRNRAAYYEFLQEQKRLEEEASEARAKAIKAKAKVKKLKKKPHVSEYRIDEALLAAEEALIEAKAAEAALEAHLAQDIEQDDEEVMALLKTIVEQYGHEFL